jgi:exonuclease SbcC
MITRVELTNFMSHRHTVIEPAAGLTVLVGPNNVGKSAVVAALQILCHNENSTYVQRHGERECSVQVHTDDGHIIQWRRKTAPSYVVDGTIFDRLRGSGLPDELCDALRLAKVDAGDAEFDVHFGTQKSPIFLLSNSAANAARFFASSSDANRLVAIQRRHKDKLAEAQREKKHLEAQAERVNAELGVLEPVIEVERRVAAAECAFVELIEREAQIEEVDRRADSLRKQLQIVAEHAAHVGALSVLQPPPELAPVEPLDGLIRALVDEEQKRKVAESRGEVLARLDPPPTLRPLEPLRELIGRLSSAGTDLIAAEGRDMALGPLKPPPELLDEASLAAKVAGLRQTADLVVRVQRGAEILAALAAPLQPVSTEEIERLVKQLRESAQRVRTLESELELAKRELAAAGEKLRAQAAGALCPVCGTALDADRLLERAAAGIGGHDHE